jgi:hypothetical protein
MTTEKKSMDNFEKNKNDKEQKEIREPIGQPTSRS